MKYLVDLHTHTNYSDGDLSPDELVKLAIKNGVKVLSITDHNSINGIKALNQDDNYIIESGIKIINGLELSAKVSIGKMHILGYGLDYNNKELNMKLDELKNNSIQSVKLIFEQLKKDYNIVFSNDDINLVFNSNHNVNRVDVAKLLIKYGYCSTNKEAFDKYLVDCFNKTRKNRIEISYEDCLKLIINSGGIPVLAHPKSLQLNKKEFLVVLEKLIKNGLLGLEAYHSSHSEEEMQFYFDVAKQYGLLISVGSDYHGEFAKPDIKLGTGINNNIVLKKTTILNELLK